MRFTLCWYWICTAGYRNEEAAYKCRNKVLHSELLSSEDTSSAHIWMYHVLWDNKLILLLNPFGNVFYSGFKEVVIIEYRNSRTWLRYQDVLHNVKTLSKLYSIWGMATCHNTTPLLSPQAVNVENWQNNLNLNQDIHLKIRNINIYMTSRGYKIILSIDID